jgi:hypothetical protein
MTKTRKLTPVASQLRPSKVFYRRHLEDLVQHHALLHSAMACFLSAAFSNLFIGPTGVQIVKLFTVAVL